MSSFEIVLPARNTRLPTFMKQDIEHKTTRTRRKAPRPGGEVSS